jgi:hypothetical protein
MARLDTRWETGGCVTAPTPPNNEPGIVKAIVEVGHRERDAAELRLVRAVQGHRLALVCVALLVVFGGWRGYVWHVEHMAKLEAAAGVDKIIAINEHTISEAWKARAIALVDSVQIDTVTMRRIIQHVKVDTILVPAMPVAQDGVTYSDPQPLVPMAVVSKLAFDSLGAACERVEHDCSTALAAKDSVITHQDSEAVALRAHDATTAKQLRIEKRTALWQKVAWGIVGIAIGRVIR